MRNIIALLLLGISFVAPAQNPLWLRYPSISPDGNKIAFTYRGDIYTVSVKGGEAKQITQHVAHDYKPVWSPDSKSIAFASDRFGNFDIYKVSSEGGEASRLTYHSSHDLPTCFHPDGKSILFQSTRMDNAKSLVFPVSRMSELYSISIDGKELKQILSTPAIDAIYDQKGENIYYHDKKGYENDWRKHHVSGEARDIWVYNIKSKEHKKLTDFVGEDRNPNPYEKGFFYLSERSGSFNIWKFDGKTHQQLTQNKNHPVRFLTKAVDDELCYSFDGELYIYSNGHQNKVDITIRKSNKTNEVNRTKLTSGISEFDVSPNGKEVVFIARGDVFVTSIDYATTKQITFSSEEERSASFSKDGDKILYASEQSGNWDIYETEKVRAGEKYFFNSTLLKESILINGSKDEFQPQYSPDGKSIAYLEDRVIVKVFDLDKKSSKEVVGKKYNYSYKDGDQSFSWSPDSKYLLCEINDGYRWTSEIAIVKADGSEEPKNLTNSGYYDFSPKWAMKGHTIIWGSDRDGYKSHGGWGAEYDIYAMFLDKKTFERHQLSKEEYKLLEKGDTLNSNVQIEWKDLDKRKKKLTIHSSNLSDAIMSPEGDKLYYLSKFEKGHDLWVTDFYENTTKLIKKINQWSGNLQWSKDGSELFILSNGQLEKIDTKSDKSTPISFTVDFESNSFKERTYIFNHISNLIFNKFYVADLHGVDWSFYTKEYSEFLPHISNNWEFTEMLSEYLGELNASHTGSGYRTSSSSDDNTASLGVIIDPEYSGTGIKISEIIVGGPLDIDDERVQGGVIIKEIDGVEITSLSNFYELLNNKSGKIVLLSIKGAKDVFELTVKSINLHQENELLYDRWIERNRQYVNEKSNGQLGYLHIRQMNDRSYRVVYDEMFGKNVNKKALVIDTRWNSGGWLHGDLIDLLQGEKYFDFEPRGQNIGSGPTNKWLKPTVLVMNEGNYSNGHMFPYLYKQLKLGKIVGMPVAGTGTAVWWEWQIDRSIYFGIPQVGLRDISGDLLENKLLEPDYRTPQDPKDIANGIDSQLDKSIELLLKELK